MAVLRGRPDFVVSSERSFRDAFARLGVDVDATVEDAARHLKRSTVPEQLGIALDNWTRLRQSETTRRDWLIAVARQVDPHALRNEIRDRVPLPAVERRAALERLAQQPEIVQLPPESLSLLAGYVFDTGNRRVALELLRRAQRAYPGDMWLDEQLGTHNAISSSDLLPPSSVAICQHLGLALEHAGQLDKAVEAFRHAVDLDPARPTSRLLLANSLLHAKHYEEAFPEYEWCYRRDPELVTAYYNSACAALLMQSEQTTLGDAARRELRDRAYAWLQQCLKLMRAAAMDGTTSAAADLAAGMMHWQGDPDLASIRTPEALRDLPETEQIQWKQFWRSIESERQAAAAAAGVSPSGGKWSTESAGP
jgi:tetratricopeptide (TPR) repeat protein